MNLSLQKKMLLSESTVLKYLLYKKYKKNKRSMANTFIYNNRLTFGEFYHLYFAFVLQILKVHNFPY